MFQERIDKLLPYLRGFAFDEATMYIRLSVLFPVDWDVSRFQSEGILRKVIEDNGVSRLYLLGVSTETDLHPTPILNDKPIDYFFNEIENVIQFNNERVKKKELFQQKVKELEKVFMSSSLDEIEKLKFTKEDEYQPISVTVATINQPTIPHSMEREPDEDIGESVNLDKVTTPALPEDYDINIPAIVQEMKENVK